MNLTILYRGPLSSCNYACDYCPFAKHTETQAELAVDRAALERFTGWIADRPTDTFRILFTPWGEGLVRKWYREALVKLTNLPNVEKAAIQTNLSCKLDWVSKCNLDKLALWCTYHPTEIDRPRFVAKCLEIQERGVKFSVGVVGMKEHLAEITALRQELPQGVYLWVNAYKRERDYYTQTMIDQLTATDPHFPLNNQYHASLGEACRTGDSVVSVDGDGVIRRCHFIAQPLGNIYAAGFEKALFARPCTNDRCGCYIGYAHMEKLNLEATFGAGLLERIPLKFRPTS
jgi:MoaA/NifB/PqqE/SkfB family radical SAM enzyme